MGGWCLAQPGIHAQNESISDLFSYYKLKTLQGCGILPEKTACKGEAEPDEAKLGGKELKERALERKH